MFSKSAFTFVFLLLFLAKSEVVFGQKEQVFEDSTAFIDFLKNQGDIPGLKYQLIDSSGTVFSDSTTDSVYQPKLVSDYGKAIDLRDSVFKTDSVFYAIQFVVYNDPNTLEATQEYVSNLLRNGDIELKSSDNSYRSDLISLASRYRYSPLISGAFSFIGDFKLFVVTLTITLFIVFAFGMILFMLFLKARSNRKEKLLVQYDEQIVGPLTEILFENSLEELEHLSDEELEKSFPAKQLKKPLYVDVLVERILALNKKMKGDFKLKLKALYKRLQLDKVSIEKLHSYKWDKVVMGLVEINEMDLTEAEQAVKKLVNSPNFQIRTQAVATVLNISSRSDLSFLRDQNFPLSRWQQMNYLRIIKYLNSSRDLNINSLFSSKNQSVRLFGYMLVRVLGLVELLAELEEKFNSVSDIEKIEIIKTFEYLGIPTETELINSSLRSKNSELVCAAAKAAGSIGDDTSARLICEILDDSPDFKLRMILLKSLLDLDKILYSQYIEENSSSQLQRIDRHLVDPLLKDV
mgnify:FL=1